MERPGILAKCLENEELAEFMLKKWKEMDKENPNGFSDNTRNALSKAFNNLCSSKNPIRNIKDFSQIKGVGKWIVKLMKEFFKTDSVVNEPEELAQKGKKTKGARRYVPQKNSAPYALLITLFRATSVGNEFMRKQELIDAAEASGLSRVPIAPELGKGKVGPGPFSGSGKEFYSGWTSMSTLVSKGYVVKSSCPAKYMLTQAGREAALECIKRSNLPDHAKDDSDSEGVSEMRAEDISYHETVQLDSDVEEISSPFESRKNKSDLTREGQSFVDVSGKKETDLPTEHMERLTKMGYTKERILRAHREVSKDCASEGMGSNWLSILCHLREKDVYGSESHTSKKETSKKSTPSEKSRIPSHHGGDTTKFSFVNNMSGSSVLRPCSSSDCQLPRSSPGNGLESAYNVLPMPPLSFGERFEDVYDVILILDNREHFANKGSRSSKFLENICSQAKIKIEVRRLPVGDGIWIARHRSRGSEYVLDFIVERKKVDDLRMSIRDNRYRDQKLRLLRCGLKKLIYLVEGDPNASEAADSIKTACFTTEILEGFDVQRTSGLGDTMKKYGNLTQAIAQYYKSLAHEELSKSSRRVCPKFSEFIKQCEEVEKLTVNDLFAIQLMQVPQVTEEVAMAVVDIYPTIISLATAYSLLDGDVAAQESMLRNQSNNVVNTAASRNIFKLVWGN